MKRFLILFTALVFLTCPLFGQATTGFHRVNQVLARAYSGVGAEIVPNATIAVTNTTTGQAATIYSDPLLTAPITPPLVTADNSGNYSYYVPLNYCVTETITAPGQSFTAVPNICGNTGTLTTPITILNGGTGEPTAAGANGSLGTPGPVFNVIGYGAVGDGVLSTATGTDNYSAIESAINAALAAQGSVFVPCGVYEFGTPITVYGVNSIPIVGPSSSCAILQYNGVSSSLGAITVASNTPATPCSSSGCNSSTSNLRCCVIGFQLKNISVVANANVSDTLDLLLGTFSQIENVNLIGSANDSIWCSDCGKTYFHGVNTTSNALGQQTGFTSHINPNGVVYDDYGSGAPSNVNTDIDQISNGSTGIAVWIKHANQTVIGGCQFSGNPVSIQIDTSSGAVIDDSCLSEAGASAGDVNVSSSSVNTIIEGGSISGNLNIAGAYTQVIGTSLLQLNIASTARGTVIDHAEIIGTSANISDLAPDTEYRCPTSSSEGSCIYNNFPSWKRVPPSLGGSSSGELFLTGSWGIGTSASNLDSAPLTGFTSAWSAVFDGMWIGTGGYQNEPESYEFTENSPTLVLSGGQTITVSISGGTPYLQISSSSSSAQFFGDITFITQGSTTVSASYARALNASGYDVSGSPLSTSNLADWTNTSVVNGNAPIWNSGTSKWTPGTPSVSTVQGGATNDILFQSATSVTGFITPVNSAVLVTSAGGVPSESTTLPNGITATTQSVGDSSTKLATDQFVQTLILGNANIQTGTVTSASGTVTTAHTFGTPFSGTPVCLASPYSSSGAWYFSTLPSSTSTGIITYTSSGAQSFAVICTGPVGIW